MCVCQIFGSRVRVDSTAKVAEIEMAEKEKMKEKVDRILKHGINCFINRCAHSLTHTYTRANSVARQQSASQRPPQPPAEGAVLPPADPQLLFLPPGS